MCGLFGAYCPTTLSGTEIDRVLELGFISSLRGVDSTGVAVVHKKGNKLPFSIRKDVVNPVTFLANKSNEQFIKDKHPILIMGHARAATMGTVNLTNAHPFDEGKIIGAHNGTMWAYAPDKKDENKTSDSKELFRAINKDGLVKSLAKTKSGAYALTFINSENRSINFIRNAERPLVFVKSKDEQTLYWASERRFLHTMMLGAGGIDLFLDPFTLNVNNLYQIYLDRPLKTGSIVDLSKKIDEEYWASLPPVSSWPRQTPYKTKAQVAGLPDIFCSGCFSNIRFCGCENKQLFHPFDYQVAPDGKSYLPKEGSVPIITGKAPGVVPMYYGYEGEKMNVKDAMTKLRKFPCVTCECVSRPHEKVQWFDKDFHICNDCYEETLASDDPKVRHTFDNCQLWEGRMRGSEEVSDVKNLH